MPNIFADLWNAVLSFFDNNILSLLKKMGFSDVIDILVLAFLFFFVYRFARKRNAIRLVTGVGLFFLVMVIGEAMNLKAIDATATAFCLSTGMPIYVFGLKNPDDIIAAVENSANGILKGTVILAQ